MAFEYICRPDEIMWRGSMWLAGHSLETPNLDKAKDEYLFGEPTTRLEQTV